MADWGEQLAAEIVAAAKRAIVRTAVECTNDLKKILSTPAPRRVAKTSGRVYAATKATPGAPPRKLTGRGRASVSYKIDFDLNLNLDIKGPGNFVAVIGTNVVYMPVHEFKTNHKWVEPTLAANGTKYERLLAGGV